MISQGKTPADISIGFKEDERDWADDTEDEDDNAVDWDTVMKGIEWTD